MWSACLCCPARCSGGGGRGGMGQSFREHGARAAAAAEVFLPIPKLLPFSRRRRRRRRRRRKGRLLKFLEPFFGSSPSREIPSAAAASCSKLQCTSASGASAMLFLLLHCHYCHACTLAASRSAVAAAEPTTHVVTTNLLLLLSC